MAGHCPLSDRRKRLSYLDAKTLTEPGRAGASACLLALFAAALLAAPKAPDATRWWSHILFLADDKLEGREICASSSNRNFKGRQGSPTGRTLLMSPAMVAAAAVAGEVVDVRELPEYGD